MVKRFPVLYPMPFGEEQYREYLELAKVPIEKDEYLKRCREQILPETPRTCKRHRNEGFKEPLGDCIDCMRYDKSMIERTVANLVRCGFLKKNRGYICPKHNRKKKRKLPKPVESCPDCKPYRGKICDFHKEMGLVEPDPDCPNCKEGHISIEVYNDGKKWLDGNLRGGFSKLVCKSLKCGWGYQMRLPGVIDAVFDILSEFSSLKLNETLSGTKLYSLLEDKKRGYDFNYAGEGSRRSLREILKLLVIMEVLKKIDRNKYFRGKKFTQRRTSLKNADMLSGVEDIIKNYGPRTQILENREKDITLKILLSKYYIYKQSGGIGKEQWFLRKIHKSLFIPIPKNSTIEHSTGRRTQLKKIKDKRKELRKKVLEKWNQALEKRNLSKENLYGINIEALDEIVNARSEDDVYFLLASYSSKFNKSILDRISHSNGLFNFPKGFEPYKWQNEAVFQWISGEGKEKHDPYHGIVSVVTGAGKTVMALLAINEYLKRFPDMKVSVIVPTKALMYQWAYELSKLLAVPSEQIGFRGDGFKDSFNDRKIMIFIVNSAIQDNFLREDVSKLDEEVNHFLIADECHRYTGEKFQKIFECRRDATLGLSATPIERENLPVSYSNNAKEPELSSILLKELGPIYYELNYRAALKENLISKFTVNFIGVQLTPEERSSYDIYTKKLAKVLEKIRLRYGNRLDMMSGTSLDQKLQVILKYDDNPDRTIGQYFRLVRERRNCVYKAVDRKGVFCHLLYNSIQNNKKTIVFHERIDQLDEIVAPMEGRKVVRTGRGRVERRGYEENVDKKLEALLKDSSYRPVMYHSGHKKDYWNYWSMEWFRDGTANTMLSVKALIEGLDVPAADCGIVRVSSSSVRQRIQATGRILRKSKKKERSEMYIIFVRDTVDENIFRKYDFGQELGSSDVKLYFWYPDEEDSKLGELKQESLESLIPIEYEDNRPPLEVDVSSLKSGDEYPGRYAGDLYHVTSDGRPYKRSRYGRIPIKTKEMIEAGQLMRKIKGGGKLLVTPQGNMVTRIKGQGIIFLGTVDLDMVRNEVKKQLDSFDKSRKKRRYKKPPTFEELFETQG